MKTINLKHFPKVIVLLVGLAFLTFDNRIASATEILKDTASPDGIVCIALVSSVDREAYKFLNTKTHKTLGDVFTPDWEERSNIIINAKWNKSGNKVAVLASYGTKLSAMFLFGRLPNGKFKKIIFDYPDPLDVYKTLKGKPFSLADSGGCDVNQLGKWIDEDSINMISGISFDSYDNKGDSDLLVSFKATVHGANAVLSNIKLLGPFSDKKYDRVIKKWKMKNGS